MESDCYNIPNFNAMNNTQQTMQKEPLVPHGLDTSQLIVDVDEEENGDNSPPPYNHPHPNFPTALPFPPMPSPGDQNVGTPQPPIPRGPGDITLDRFEQIYDALIGLTHICNDFDSMNPVIPNLHHMFKVVERNHARHVITVPYEEAHARKQMQIKKEVVAERGLSRGEMDNNTSDDFAPVDSPSGEEVEPPPTSPPPPPQDNFANDIPSSTQPDMDDKETEDSSDDLIEDDV